MNLLNKRNKELKLEEESITRERLKAQEDIKTAEERSIEIKAEEEKLQEVINKA